MSPQVVNGDTIQTSPEDAQQPSSPGFGERLGQGFLKGIAQSSPLGNAVYNAFKEPTAPTPGPYARYNASTQVPQPGNGQAPLPQTVAAPPAPPVDTGGPSASSQWGASAPKSGLLGTVAKAARPQSNLADTGAGAAASGNGASAAADAGVVDAATGPAADAALMMLGGGGIVTKPTLARIGERGPEAVVPLTPRPGNKLQPDLLEGHVTAPKVPGVKYSRYKSFNRFGSGGA